MIVDRIPDRGRLVRLDGSSIRTKRLANDASLHDVDDNTSDRRLFGTYRAASFPVTLRRALTPGLIGGFTTGSSFNYETTRLLQEGARGDLELRGDDDRLLPDRSARACARAPAHGRP